MKEHLLLTALVAALILPGVALGQGITYDDVANNNFSAIATWTYTGIPTGTAYPSQPGDTALIDSNTVTLDVSVPASVSIALASGTIQVPNTAPTVSASIAVTSPSSIYNAFNYNSGIQLYLAGPITGTGLLTMANGERGVQINSAANTFSGGWLIKGGGDYYWGTIVNADMALGTGAINVTGGSLQFLKAQSYGTGTNPAQPLINVNAGGTVWFSASDDLDVTLNGGKIYVRGVNVMSGDVTVTAPSSFTGGTDYVYGNDLTLSGTIAGSGKLTVLSNARELTISNANPGFSGGWEVGQVGGTAGILSAKFDGALGTGSLVVNNGYLAYGAFQTATVVATVNGGNVRLNLPAATPLNANLTMAGGAVTTSGAGSAQELAGTVTLTGNAGLNTGAQAMTVSAQIVESGGAYKITKAGGAGAVTLTNGTNNYSGGTDVTLGLLNVNAVHALGTGTATAKGGTIQNNIDNAFASVPTVIAAENGSVILNANENSASILIQAGGAFATQAGFTSTLDYSGTPNALATNVQVEAGAILDAGLPSTPAPAQFLPGDGGFGAFKAATSGTHNVGTNSGTIYRGLAASANATFNLGSVTETPGGTEGIGMLATTPATFTYTNSIFTTDAGHTLKLYGAGTHAIGAGNTFNSDIDMEGPGRVQLTAAGAISGHALNVNNGRLEVTSNTALGGAQANINDGGIFLVGGQSLSSGTVSVKEGGVVTWDRDATRFSAGAAWDFQPGSGLLLTTAWDPPFVYPLGSVAAPVPVNIFTIDGNAGWFTKFTTNDVPMGDDSRITTAAKNATEGLNPGSVYTKTCKFYVVPGDESGRFTAPTGATLPIGGTLDFTGKTLIIGDVNPFSTPIQGGASGFAMLGQAGTVLLTDSVGYMGNDGPTTVIGIGKIDVQAGTFQMQRHAMLGGATEINVNAGATMYFAQGAGLTLTNTLVKGNGTVRMAAGQTLALGAGGVIAPGPSAGSLAVTGNLTVSNDGAGNYGQVQIEVASSGNVPGDDHDALAVSGTANVTAGELLVSLAVPSAAMKPTTPNWAQPGTPTGYVARDLGDMTVLTAGVAVTGTFASERLDADPRLAGIQTTGPWMLKTGAILADYVDSDASGLPDQVILKGADIVWIALPGDANLDNITDVSDLSLLAGNFRKTTGMTWLQGDFNFDGAVDVSDLSLLAGRFRQTNPFPPLPPVGGAPVPEPVTMVLLGLGGLAVLARRRK